MFKIESFTLVFNMFKSVHPNKNEHLFIHTH